MKTQIWAPIFGAVMAAGLASAGAVSAATTDTFYLTEDGCSSACIVSSDPTDPSGNPYVGTVTVTQDAGALDFSVDLIKGVEFNVAGKSGTHHSLAFDLVSTGPLNSLAGLKIADSLSTPGFTGTIAGGLKDSPFGTFDDAVNYTGSLKSNGTTNPTTLSFTVTDSGNNLSLSNLTSNSVSKVGQVYLAADVFANRNTGNVGALAGTPSIATPEPASWALMLLGVGLTGASLRSRRRTALARA
jgi:hypothetical protein